MTWQKSFDRLVKAMTQGEPHKAAKRRERSEKREASDIESETPR
jgi:hypothetical protein